MAYDESVAERVRQALKRRKNITERKMFGGIAFLLNGNMCCGVTDESVVLRLGEEGTATALKRAYTREMDFTGKPLKTMVYVGPRGYRTEQSLKDWIAKAVTYTKTLPAK